MDYRDFERKPKDKPSDAANKFRSYWWKEKGDDAAAAVVAAAKHLIEQQRYRSEANLRHARLYGNFPAIGFGLRNYGRSAVGNHVNHIALNVIASCIDTLAAKIAKNKPKPTFLTSDGSWAMKQKAKKLDKFARGQFYEMGIYRLGRRAFVDTCVFGLGALKFFERHGRIACERTLPEELLVDDDDAIHGEPRQLFQRKYLPRELLIDAFGDDKRKRAAIDAAKSPDDEWSASHHALGDMVEVYESWHLPSNAWDVKQLLKKRKRVGVDDTDGRHIIAIEGCTLAGDGDEDVWGKSRFPFSFFRLNWKLVGFWGQGLAERLFPLQVEINRILEEITEALRLVSKPRVFVSGRIIKSHINNDIGTIVTVPDNTIPPVISNANAVPAEQFQQLERLVARAYEEAGISQMTAGGRRPAGLQSGVAIREAIDVESERFALAQQDYEEGFLEACAISIDGARDLAMVGGSYKVKLQNKRAIEEIDWRDIDLDEDDYKMQMFPTSGLPQTPQGRLQMLEDLKNLGVLEQEELRSLLDFPDLDSSTSLATAMVDDVDATIAAILEADEPKLLPPEDYQNLPLLIRRGNAAYLRARQEGAPDDRLGMLRQLIDAAADLQAQLEAEAQPNPDVAMGGAPGAVPPPATPGAPLPPGPPVPLPQ